MSATPIRRDPESLERSRDAVLIDRLRREAAAHDDDFANLRERLSRAEHELADLRAIRDALTPSKLPDRPGLDLAASFVPAQAERVSGDFFLVAEGPRDATVLVIGDVVGHGLDAARRAAFIRTVFVATAPFSDDPSCLLSWVNTALVERAGTTFDFATAACVTYLPSERRLRWAYAGHPPALHLNDGRELVAVKQGSPLGIADDPKCQGGSLETAPGDGVLLYTDGLTEARRDGEQFGIDRLRTTLQRLQRPSPATAIAALRVRAAAFAPGALTDDLCLLAARLT